MASVLSKIFAKTRLRTQWFFTLWDIMPMASIKLKIPTIQLRIQIERCSKVYVREVGLRFWYNNEMPIQKKN